ncbi:hypothetical protein [Patiriisocius marinus]|uniref:Uncharacterized protein n=1 Tax=Patiriisocius marinus TaxID=1397112 RepID=A0A5J4J2Z6_9FLAO|nr:hypothetical protein [Patiriisocius marinus]GER60230.1 hypothetical protein ULMA_23380 [Patiriisocius marinus]
MRKFIFLLSIGILSCNSQQKKENIQSLKTESKTVERLSGKQIVSELDNLEFFNLVEASELEIVKKGFAESKNKWNFFSGTMRGETTDYTDNRFYSVDCEVLFESGGLTEYLNKVKLSFEKLGLKLSYTNEKSEQIENYWKHTIELNGTEYIAFNGNFTEYNWVIAYLNFIKMLNMELTNQKSENRFYPIKCGNDGEMVLLTFKQFDFIKSQFPDDNEHPKRLIQWKNINGFKNLTSQY